MTTTPTDKRFSDHGITIDIPDAADIIKALGAPLEDYSHQCHAASIEFVKAGLVLPGSRVARGTCPGVGGQHSWIVVPSGDGLADCYADPAIIVDPTLWSYRADVEGVWVGSSRDLGHRPHGWGPAIIEWGRPPYPVGTPIPLAADAYAGLGAMARLWVDQMFGPLDRTGWMALVNSAPMRGWPAGEIIAAMDDTPDLTAFVPIDLLGMLTDRNPGGLYLAGA